VLYQLKDNDFTKTLIRQLEPRGKE